MRWTAIAAGSLITSGLMLTTVSATPKWTCTAKKLVNYSYNGGSRAMIHLSPYTSGGRYKVTKVSDTKVTGKTKNGTTFTCVKK